MFNSVQYVRDICKQRKIPISQLEKDCGFSNGYLNPKKMSKIPYDRAQVIAEYLGISLNLIMSGEETEKAPTETGKRTERNDVLDDIDIAFYGEFKALSDDQKATIRDMVLVMRKRRAQSNK